jgi:hypothetical protein
MTVWRRDGFDIDTAPERLDVDAVHDERAAVQVSLDQANRGEFVSDAEMEAFWRRSRARRYDLRRSV